MKQNQKKRFNNGRFNNRNQQKQITRNTVFDSTGPCGKLRGTPLQLVEKYQAGAKDALMQNDIVLAQTCMQFADHYIRLQNLAIQNEQRGNQNNQPRQQREVDVQDELPEIQMPEAKESEAKAEDAVMEQEASAPVAEVESEVAPVAVEKAEKKAEVKEKPVAKEGKAKPVVVKVKRKVKAVETEAQAQEVPAEVPVQTAEA